jgi:preprotein translocase subunit SecD
VSRRRLLVPLIAMVVAALAAVLITASKGSKPVLGLDLQGGFSVVLQAKEVNGRLPSEEAVEKAKDIIRQRVDGLGVAEPDITRQGRTVVVQLPGVKNREKAESLVGCTARLEFRPVLSETVNPDFIPSTTGSGSTTTTTKGGSTTTTAAGGSTSTTAAGGGSTTSTTAASTTSGTGETGMGETGTGMVGIAPGEGALPVQFAPTTTTTAPPSTTTTAPPSTTSTTAATTTTTTGDTTTTTAASGSTSSCGSSGVTAPTVSTTTAPGTPAGATTLPSEDGSQIYTLGPIGFTGDVLSGAKASLDNSGEWVVNVSVKGSQKGKANASFNDCYNGAAGCPPLRAGEGGAQRGAIAIVLDGKVISAPSVNGPDLASGSQGFTISGSFDQGSAKDLALVLRYGSLPVEFEQAALQQVSATLGSDSLRAGMIAGAVGIAALALYMILYYRGFGMVVVVSLLVWGALMWGIICLLSATQGLALSLAGITGIIVSVGTTVDTYVVVFERIKDEVRSGRTIRRATELGYESGIKTVLTANGAAFIGAFLLWYLTVGPVRGFAYFLGISVLLDLAVAVLFTRPLLLLITRSPKFARARFFGVGSATDQVAFAKGAAS